jgi:hypothetical protein
LDDFSIIGERRNSMKNDTTHEVSTEDLLAFVGYDTGNHSDGIAAMEMGCLSSSFVVVV